MTAIKKQLNHASMNAQQDMFCTSSEDGISVFSVLPYPPSVLLRIPLTGNAKMANVIHRGNVVAFVGGGPGTKYPLNTALLWDDDTQEIGLEYTVPYGPILNLLMTSNRLILVQDKRIYFFSYPGKCSLIRVEETRYNPNGLVAVSVDELTGQHLAFPGFKIGSVRLLNVNAMSEHETLAPATINAHIGEIAALAINNQGTLLATGSEKGTVIRVFETRTQRPLVELRRGNVQASLHCLSFSPCSTYMAVSSDKGTVHVYAIRDGDEPKNQVLRQVGLVKGNSDVAKVSIEPRVLSIGFTKATSTSLQSLIAICNNNTIHRYSFTNDGHVTRENFDLLKDLGEEQNFFMGMYT